MRVKDAAKILNVSPSTIRMYCEQGIMPHTRTPGGHRYITNEDIQEFKQNKGLEPDIIKGKTAFYVRSSSGDKKLIQAQIDELTKAYGEPDKIYSDNASGLNEKRPGLQRLLKDLEKDKYDRVCATYRDRLTRFGFTYIEQLIEKSGASVNILNDKAKYSIEQELMDDFMSLIASFSGRFYRLRGYKHQRELLAAANDIIDDREEKARAKKQR